VEHICAPEGGDGQDWCRYVLRSERSTIVGHMRGSLEDVKAYAIQSAERMNARGRSTRSGWTGRKKNG
jgi:hypothetical protein